MKGFNYRKSTQALNLFSHKEGGEINKMKAIKLVWLADRLHLRQFGRTITGDTYFAFKLGPVGSATRDIVDESGFLSQEESDYSGQFLQSIDRYRYTSTNDVESKVFSKTDLSILEEVYRVFGGLNEFELSDFSHEFPEWKKWESSLKNNKTSRFLMSFSDFFNDDANHNQFFSVDPEDLELVKDLFLRTESPVLA